MHGLDGMKAYAYQDLAAIGISQALTIPTPTSRPPRGVLVTVDGSYHTARWDGQGQPDATSGHVIADGGSLVLIGSGNVDNLELFAPTGTARITYYR